jgi:hypothetical protein
MFPDAKPGGRSRPAATPHCPPAAALTAEQKRHIAAVNEPVLFDWLIQNGALRVQISGAPRADSTRAFLNLLEEFAEKREFTLEEVTKITRRDTESSTYLFTHTERDAAALEQFAQDLKAEFKKRARELPVPLSGNEFQIRVRTFPDRPHQLNAVLNRLEELAADCEVGSVNLLALYGWRDPAAEEGVYSAELRFVITLPRKLVTPGDAASHARLEDEIRRLAGEGEEWRVKVRPYTGQFIDVMAGGK